MLIRLRPRQDERAALAFEDIASGLEAGLDPVMLGADHGTGDDVLEAILRNRGIAIDATEQQVLHAAWQAGRAEAALRSLASARRQRAAFAADFLRRLSYPALLCGMALVASLISAWSIGNGSVLAITVGVLLTLVGCVVALVRGLVKGSPWLLRLPLIGDSAQALAELPYLQVLQALYASGVPLNQAHPRALAAYPFLDGRKALAAADAILQQGNPLTQALASIPATTRALDAETLQLVRNGEQAGDLERALHHALERRQSVAGRRLSRLAQILGSLVYIAAVLIALYVIFSFYSGYFGQLRSLLR
jgi:type II secretory pathway component PulF